MDPAERSVDTFLSQVTADAMGGLSEAERYQLHCLDLAEVRTRQGEIIAHMGLVGRLVYGDEQACECCTQDNRYLFGGIVRRRQIVDGETVGLVSIRIADLLGSFDLPVYSFTASGIAPCEGVGSDDARRVATMLQAQDQWAQSERVVLSPDLAYIVPPPQ